MRNVAMFILGAAVFVGAVGCPPVTPPPPPASAVLAGDWTGTDADGLVVTVTFNNDGIVVSVARDDGVSAAISNSTTDLDGDAVTITIGERTYTGTVSEDQNTISGTVDQDITVGDGDVVITIPAGDFAIVRVPADPCDGVTCEDGESCVDGDCVADDPCDGVTCEAGESCVDGDCVADDPCEGITCADCEACVDGVCEPLEGDAAAGETYYASDEGRCSNCHGPDGLGAFGPSLIDADCSLIFGKLTDDAIDHTGGKRDITGQDAADLEAWLAP